MIFEVKLDYFSQEKVTTMVLRGSVGESADERLLLQLLDELILIVIETFS